MPPLTPNFSNALVLAARLHRDQTRKMSDTPYLAHLMSVAALVLEHGGDEDVAIAALLHGAIEDQNESITLGEIGVKFGPRVAALVCAVTETDQTPKPPWRERKEAYLTLMRGKSADALLIAAADKLHNARATLEDYRLLGEKVWDRFNAGKADQEWWYRSVIGELRMRDGKHQALTDELARVVDQLFPKSHRFQIIAKDNYDREDRDERVVAKDLGEFEAQLMVDGLNSRESDLWYVVKPSDYVPYRFEP